MHDINLRLYGCHAEQCGSRVTPRHFPRSPGCWKRVKDPGQAGAVHAGAGAYGGKEQECEIGRETRPENAADSLQKDDPSSFDMDMFPCKDTALEKLFISVRR